MDSIKISRARHAAAAEYVVSYDTNLFAAIATGIVTSWQWAIVLKFSNFNFLPEHWNLSL